MGNITLFSPTIKKVNRSIFNNPVEKKRADKPTVLNEVSQKHLDYPVFVALLE